MTIPNLTIDGAKELDAIDNETATRGVVKWMECSNAPTTHATALSFIAGYSIGERAALRHAAKTLADPRARGIEWDVFRGLVDGLDGEEAIRQARRGRR